MQGKENRKEKQKEIKIEGKLKIDLKSKIIFIRYFKLISLILTIEYKD